eukprot:15445694-Alexandrium_andersonii.AAC.1
MAERGRRPRPRPRLRPRPRPRAVALEGARRPVARLLSWPESGVRANISPATRTSSSSSEPTARKG